MEKSNNKLCVGGSAQYVVNVDPETVDNTITDDEHEEYLLVRYTARIPIWIASALTRKVESLEAESFQFKQ